MAHTIRTPEKERDFLAALAATCSVTQACEDSDVSRRVVYEWRAADVDFAARWDEAKRIGAEALEDEAVRRAARGVDEPVFHQGAQVGTVRKYSDTLAIFLLKGAMPEKYRDNAKLELAGRVELSKLSDDELDQELLALQATVGHNALATPVEDDGSDLC